MSLMVSLAWIAVAIWQTRKQTVMAPWAWVGISLVLALVITVVVPIAGVIVWRGE